jgi:thiol-disulfide isomerase/thioredoxin
LLLFTCRALLEANQDKIVVIKFFAPWCRACKAVEPKYIQITRDEKYLGLPLVFAQLSIQHSKDYVKNLGILALPSVQMYAGEFGLVESFPCGPSKVPVLKKKIAQVVNDHVDPTSLLLKKPSDQPQQANPDGFECDLNTQESVPCTERQVVPGIITPDVESHLRVGDVIVSEQMMKYLRYDIPFFKDFTDDEFQGLMSKAKYVTFEPGAVIMRQGNVVSIS